MVEGIEQESILSILDIKDIPITLTTTEANLTGSWRYLSPKFEYKISPCTNGCPLNNNIPLIVKMLKVNNINGAINILRNTNPLPATLGRICPNFCEKRCTRNFIDDKVLIGRIERYLGDLALDVPFNFNKKEIDIDIAIIGGGPSALACAYFLKRYGCKVTIFEKKPFLGGLLVSVIPEYRLPKSIVEKEINKLITELDIEVQLNYEVSMDDLQKLIQEKDNVVVACGLSKGKIPNEFSKIEGVVDGITLLETIKSKKEVKGNSFLVIGGGNAAIDAARSLIRLGKYVKIIYRRTIDDMPAYKEEIEQALMEKVPIWEKRVVSNIEEDQGKLVVELSKTEIVNKEVFIRSKEEKLEVDGVVFAIGQESDFDVLDVDNVFKVGDFELGASTVAQSMASGISVAKKILLKKGVISKKDREIPIFDPEKLDFPLVEKKQQVNVPVVLPDKLMGNFEEVVKDVDDEEIKTHVDRCLECGTCTGCNTCWFFCPDMCINIKETGGSYMVDVDLSHCKGCGICSNVCPRGMITMEEG